ncbi:MAG: hypothetical protein U1E73_12545 [Planctomycetota bacterium]
MNKTPWLLVPLLLLGAAGTWFLVARSGEPDLRPPTAPEATGPAAPVDPGAEAGSIPVADAVGGDAVEPAARDAVLTREALLPIPDDARWATVRIVDKETREAVPGAEVGWYDDTITAELQKRPELVADRVGLLRDAEALSAQFGWQTRSDANGLARVHQTDSTQVCARLGDRYGQARLGANLLPPRDGFEIAIEADYTVRVQVLDAEGAPAVGVPIAVGIHDAAGKLQNFRNWGTEAETRAPDGIAMLPHVQAWGRDQSKVAEWRVHYNLPGLEDEGAIVALDPPPTEPILLRLPECGGMRVRLDARDDELLGRHMVHVRGSGANSMRMWMRFVQQPLAADGWARFPFLPLGQKFDVGTTYKGGWINQQVSGPVAAHVEVEVVLAPDQKQIQLTGRLLDEARQPLARQKFALLATGNHEGSREVTTDDRGGFVVLIGAAREGHNQVDAIVATVASEGETPRTARLPGRELHAGTENLGDLVLQADPIVVAGHFVVDGSTQKADANATVERLTPRDGEREERWNQAEELPCHQAADGSFEVRGLATPGRYRLRAWSNTLLQVDPVEFAPGAKDVVIAMTSGGKLAATVLLPEDAPGSVVGRLVPVPPRPDMPKGERARLDRESWGRPDGRHQIDWRGLTCGTYRLEIALPAFQDALVAIDDVQLAVSPAGDPRLVDIDLRDLVRIQALRATDAEGKPARVWESGCFPMPQDDRKEVLGLPLQGSETRFLLPRRPVEMLVAFAGYRPQRVVLTGEPAQVRLDKWPTVTLTFPALPDLPKGCQLFASLATPAEVDQRRYRAQWSSGLLSHLLAPGPDQVRVENGKVELPIGDGPQAIALHVRNRRKTVAVEIPAQTATMAARTVAVQVTEAAIQKAAAAASEQKQ